MFPESYSFGAASGSNYRELHAGAGSNQSAHTFQPRGRFNPVGKAPASARDLSAFVEKAVQRGQAELDGGPIALEIRRRRLPDDTLRKFTPKIFAI